jgi:hypothetical protein
LPQVLAIKRAGVEERQNTIDALVRQIGSRRSGPAMAGPIGSSRDRTQDVDALRREYARAVTEIAALRNSLSWRLTAPLRRVYDMLARPDRSPAREGIQMSPGIRRPTDVPPPPALPRSVPAADAVEDVLMPYEAMFVQQRERLEQLQEQLRVIEHEHHAPQPAVGLDAINWGELRRCTPISSVWGTDRGRPLDRHYIEAFLGDYAQDVRGAVLEVKDSAYTERFGEHRVRTSHVVDIDRTNPHATLVADLAGVGGIGSRQFDCIILTQTLGLIFDLRAALRNVADALKRDGVLLCTLPASGRVSYEPPGLDGDFWRFTSASTHRLFAEVFPQEALTIRGYGNVLARAAFLYGLAAHELSAEELEIVDPYFPVIFGIRAVRTWP